MFIIFIFEDHQAYEIFYTGIHTSHWAPFFECAVIAHIVWYQVNDGNCISPIYILLLLTIGCPVLEPPTRGAHVCLTISDVIYCSVYCDHLFEFSDVPRNPYQCGSSTNFLWRDGSGHNLTDLPKCTGTCMYYCTLKVLNKHGVSAHLIKICTCKY